MSRNYKAAEYNTFVKGFVTEASPLTFPEDASLDEENFKLNHDGSRSRRLGLDLEDNFTPYSLSSGEDTLSAYRWIGAGGSSTTNVVCVQAGSRIDFFYESDYLSGSKFYDYTLSGTSPDQTFSFSQSGDDLIVVCGSKDIHVFTYEHVCMTHTYVRLKIKDLLEIDDKATGRDLLSPDSINYMTTEGEGIIGQHIYNLWNRGCGIPRLAWEADDLFGETVSDPIDTFEKHKVYSEEGHYFQRKGGKWPSNADSVSPYLYADTTAENGSKTVKRFDSDSAFKNNPGNTSAPYGYFIIDALDRSSGRIDAIKNLYDTMDGLNGSYKSKAISAIKKDESKTGPTVSASYSGRAWFGGFTDDTIGGDGQSPKLGSYVFFSQLTSHPSDVFKCYQDADPTDADKSGMVDTDGGFVRIKGMQGIVGMESIGTRLFILAKNGVWMLSGPNGAGFSDTGYETSLLTKAGCISKGSVVAIKDNIFYWSEDGIYLIHRNEFGDYISDNITDSKIKKYFISIGEQA